MSLMHGATPSPASKLSFASMLSRLLRAAPGLTPTTLSDVAQSNAAHGALSSARLDPHERRVGTKNRKPKDGCRGTVAHGRILREKMGDRRRRRASWGMHRESRGRSPYVGRCEGRDRPPRDGGEKLDVDARGYSAATHHRLRHPAAKPPLPPLSLLPSTLHRPSSFDESPRLQKAPSLTRCVLRAGVVASSGQMLPRQHRRRFEASPGRHRICVGCIILLRKAGGASTRGGFTSTLGHARGKRTCAPRCSTAAKSPEFRDGACQRGMGDTGEMQRRRSADHAGLLFHMTATRSTRALGSSVRAVQHGSAVEASMRTVRAPLRDWVWAPAHAGCSALDVGSLWKGQRGDDSGLGRPIMVLYLYPTFVEAEITDQKALPRVLAAEIVGIPCPSLAISDAVVTLLTGVSRQQYNYCVVANESPARLRGSSAISRVKAAVTLISTEI
ncbi:hypothetical protein DFH08DRAFT_805286 [Mycena albidolilacea]|uniref:Uncharacterized protein n=1 Tax=Mycena albidolilacea TaxID=1033008 RepID=A0AAD7EUG6_9AGAR|nr:hypothetical protein DFH08DRAFT_805286 [Mycena albidolilacea]